MIKKVEILEKYIKYNFNNKKILNEALTHSSYSNEYKKSRNKNNERLEFLGDSILGLIISTHLFNLKKDLPEGELTKIRAAIVCERSLKEVAKKIELGDFLMLGKGEETTGGRKRDSILADAVEALIAAIYIDSDFAKASEFVLEIMNEIITEAIEGKIMRDYKTQLQEIIQKYSKDPIIYKLTDQMGPDHDKIFKMQVSLSDKVIGSGSGKSKKEAEQQSAKDALGNI